MHKMKKKKFPLEIEVLFNFRTLKNWYIKGFDTTEKLSWVSEEKKKTLDRKRSNIIVKYDESQAWHKNT